MFLFHIPYFMRFTPVQYAKMQSLKAKLFLLDSYFLTIISFSFLLRIYLCSWNTLFLLLVTELGLHELLQGLLHRHVFLVLQYPDNILSKKDSQSNSRLRLSNISHSKINKARKCKKIAIGTIHLKPPKSHKFKNHDVTILPLFGRQICNQAMIKLLLHVGLRDGT